MEIDSKQIMFIDNDEVVRESLGMFLSGQKMKYLIFKSAKEGLNSLKYQKIDVVVADYFLPDMDGLSFLKKVAGHNQSAARILMATIVNDELEKEIVASGIDALIVKPLNVASMDQILYQMCKKNMDNKKRPENKNE